MSKEVDFFSPWARRIMLRTPQLFGEGPWDPAKTNVGFGFACGPGWFPLIEKTLSKLARIAREDGLDRMRSRQIKEKFGGLRIYLSDSNDRARAVIEAAQLASLKICDLCAGDVRTPPERVGWIFTRCAPCMEGKLHAEKILRSTRLECGPMEKQYRVLVLSDVHLDFWLDAKAEPLPGLDYQVFQMIDAVILAGDITNKGHVRWKRAMEWLGERVDLAKVWVFQGNHDYYSGEVDRDDKLRAIVEGYGGHFAQKSVIHIGGRRFLCCTLWTDMTLGGSIAENMVEAERVMNDYKYIRLAKRGYARLRPADTIAIHRDHLDWLKHSLATHFEGETVVISHHAPLPDCLPSEYTVSACYASDLSALILQHQPLIWAHGHVHQHRMAQLGRTRILNVSLGYPAAVDPQQPRNDPMQGLISWIGPRAVGPASAASRRPSVS